MAVASMRELLEAGVHFGHQTRRWNPKMRRFIFTERSGIYIIDLTQTSERLEEAAQPPLRDVHRACAVSLFLHDVDELALGADEEDVLAAQDDIARECLRHLQLTQCLLEIDDVDAVALREDETAHLRVPATGLVAEVNSGG